MTMRTGKGLVVLLPLVFSLAACFAAPQEGVKGSDAPAMSASQNVATEITRVELAQGIYELVYSKGLDAIFVASAGSPAQPISKILRLDPQTLAVQAEIPLERAAYGLALDEQAQRLYVGNGQDASVTVIDLPSATVLATVQMAEKVVQKNWEKKDELMYPHSFRQLVLDKKHQRLYLPGAWFQNSALYVMDTERLALEKVIPGLGFLATGAALNEAEDKLYVSNLQGQLFTFNTATLELETLSELPGDQLLNLAWDAQGKRLFATDQGLEMVNGMRTQLSGIENYVLRGQGNQVLAIDPQTAQLLHKIPTGAGPIVPLLDTQRQRLYVSNREAGTVTVYDAESYDLLATVDLPTHPNSLALDQDNGTVYVTIKNKRGQTTDESVARIN